LFLDSQATPRSSGDSVQYAFTIEPGDEYWFLLRYGAPFPFNPVACETSLQDTIDFWHRWVHSCDLPSCVFEAPWHDQVVRSGLILKLLTHEETGAIFAAPTTSLPEAIGGSRNWDYRFNWIRDASFTIQALHHLGHETEARAFLRWFRDIRKNTRKPADLKIMYSAHGDRHIEEFQLSYLSGYRDSKPVRIGNGAANQWQLDIYGEIINSVYELVRYDQRIDGDEWNLIRELVDYVGETWRTRDAGIWEFRNSPRHFVYSKLMSWVAVDRGIKIAEREQLDAPLEGWRHTRAEIKQTILERGFNKNLNSFVMYFDSDILDACTLLIPLMGLIPFYDARVKGTVNAIQEHLATSNGLVYRYKTDDGFESEEGAFVICSFWLIMDLIFLQRIDEAEKIFRGMLEYLSPLGLMAEEIDPETGEQLGNYPQAFSHIGLINAALYLGKARKKSKQVPELLGLESG